MTIATLTTTAAVMPAFLFAAASPLLREDLDLPGGAIGMVVGAFFGVQALTSTWGGHRAEQLGPRNAMRASSLGAAATLAALALIGRGPADVTLTIGIAGLFNGIAQPATNLALAHVRSRPALTYSLKQASVPFATMLAGLLIPIVALPFGWRAVFGIASMLAVLIALGAHAIPATTRSDADYGQGRVKIAKLNPLVFLSISAGLGTASVMALASYLMDGSARVGLSVSTAGWLLSVCGIVGIIGRLLAGWTGDRWPGNMPARMAMMLAVGAVGFPLLATNSAWLFATGSLVIYGFGWGWSGVLWYAVVRARPSAPAVASGIVGVGAAAGACLGPLAFGAMLNHMALDRAWFVAGLGAVVACGCAAIANQLIAREQLAQAVGS